MKKTCPLCFKEMSFKVFGAHVLAEHQSALSPAIKGENK